ncbi:MAG: hypothetical protein EOP88_10475 [Verrucomicrobiaceae bacterium]|nr:MAG: hypothetical protein EOP88_10475 [Verrucomicrobiaceae bacterium]
MVPEVLTYVCPYCGCEARVGKPCPGCVKKDKKAKPKKRLWEQDKAHDGLNLPDDEFDYDEFVAREFGKSPHKELGVKWYWWALGVVVLVAMAAGAFLLR